MLADPLRGSVPAGHGRASAAGVTFREPRRGARARLDDGDALELAGLTLTRRPHPGPHPGLGGLRRRRTDEGRRRGRSPATRCSPGRSAAPTCPAASREQLTWRACRDTIAGARRRHRRAARPRRPRPRSAASARTNPFLQDLTSGSGRWRDGRELPHLRGTQGRPRLHPAGLGRVRRRPRRPAARRAARRVRPHRAADLRGHRAVRARGRRVHRRGLQGDVHLRRPRRPVGDPAAGGHRGRDARGDRARPRPRRAAGQAAATRARSSATSVRRPAATGSCSRSGSRRSASTTPRWTPRSSPSPTRVPRRWASTGFRLEITSLGDDTCRPAYRELLQEFLFGLDLDEATRRARRDQPAAGARRQAPRGARDDSPTRR